MTGVQTCALPICTANYNALLFVPSHRPYDFYTQDYEKGLALYASGVLIMENPEQGGEIDPEPARLQAVGAE